MKNRHSLTKDILPSPGDWKWSDGMLLRAVRNVMRAIHVDTSHDIPYLAGYSKDGSTAYIDRHEPRLFTDSKGKSIDTINPLVMHEMSEKAIEDELGLPYQFAHQIALRVERAVVEAEGVSWKEYCEFMERYIKEIGNERVADPPDDLDLKPYIDEADMKELHRICLHR